MKRIMVFILLIMVCAGLFAEIYRINPGQNSVDLLSSNQQHTQISFTISSFEYQPVQIGSETFYQLRFGKEANSYEKGYPEVPQIHRNIIIPDQARMRVSVTESSYIDIPMAIAPSKGIITRNINPSTVPFTFSPIYQKADLYPSAITELSTPFILRDFRGITVTASPFVYYTLTRTLRVYTHMVLDITADGTDEVNTLVRRNHEYSKYFESIYQNQFMNFAPDRYTLVNDRGRMIVIAPNSYLSTVQPLVDWKNQKGLNTTLVDFATIGSTNTALKTYIQNQYALGDGLTYILLCGDASQIPSFSVSGGGSDPSYSLVAGSDNYPDIIIGRFSAETTTQLQTQVDRSIQYERDLTTSATWLQSATGIASNEGGVGQGDMDESDAIHMNYIRSQLLTYGYSSVDQIYQGTGGNTAGISSALNSGRGSVNYVGHGSSTGWGSVSFSNTDVAALTNANKLPFIMNVACVNGNFVSLTCFAEAWMRATNGGSPSGAIGIYASSINQSWSPPMLAQDEFTDLLTAGTKNTLGGLYYNSSCKMMENYGADGQETFLTWNIFGDPSLQIRSKTPSTMTVSYPASIPVGSTSITVSTGVTDALVCLYHNSRILGSGYTSSSGSITLSLANMPGSPASLTMTVTAFNKVSHVGSVALVNVTGPWIAVDSYTYGDANNNLVDYNETGHFNITYKNLGITTATSIATTLSTTATGITISDNTESISSLAAGASTTVNNAYTFSTANNIVDQTFIPFHIAMVSGSDNWTYDFETLINAPAIAFGSITISDPTGNNNGRLDPGETVTITIPLNNTGHAASVAGTATMTSSTSGVTITNETYSASAISAGGHATATFTMTLSSSMIVGSIVTLNFNATAGAYTASKTETPGVGLYAETFETGNLSALAWITAGTTPYWSVVNTGANSGSYCAKSGAITHSQSTDLKVTMNITNTGNITFFYKVSSEETYDFLKFYIDSTETGSWSGDVAWTQATYAVSAGTHTFKWTYYKDSLESYGSDCSWVDDIVFPPSSGSFYTFDPPRSPVAMGKNGAVTLSWIAPASGIPASYKVYRGGFAIATGITGLTYTNSGLTNGTSYSYYVTAVYTSPGVGESEGSSTASAIPIAAPPTSLTATPGNTLINLSWSAPMTEIPNGYNVYRNSLKITATPITATTYSDNGLTNGISYSYYVTSVFTTPAAESAASNIASSIPGTTLIVIGTGSTTQTYPFDRNYSYSAYESIYLQSEINMAGSLTTIGFNKSSGSNVNSITSVTIYMKHTSSSTLDTGTYSTSGYTLVYSGSYTNNSTSGWMEVALTSPFIYNNTSNLQVLIVKGYQSTLVSGYPLWTYTTTSTNYRTRFNRNNSSAPTSLTSSYYRANIRMTIVPPVPNPAYAIDQANLDFGNVMIGQNAVRTFTITNNGGGSLSGNITTPTGYSVTQDTRNESASIRNTLAYSVMAGYPVTFNVTFAPSLEQTYPGDISITSNDPLNPSNTLAVTGTGVTSQIGIPMNLNIQPQNGSLLISWEEVPSAGTYYLYRSTKPYGVYTCVAEIHTNSYMDMDTAGQSYFYYVTSDITAK